MNIIIIGCGRLGAQLAIDWSQEGHEITIVDVRPRAFSRLPQDLRATVILGTGIDEDVLRNAGIEDAGAFIAVTDNDNTNIMSAQLAQKVFGIRNVILRVYDPVRAAIYERLGMTVICTTSLVAGIIEDSLKHELAE